MDQKYLLKNRTNFFLKGTVHEIFFVIILILYFF